MENDSTFTPGPWAHWLDEDTNKFSIYQDLQGRSYGRWIAEIQGIKGQSEANARLVAAAPEMAIILRRAAEQLAHCLGNENPIVVEARDLLAKAGTK